MSKLKYAILAFVLVGFAAMQSCGPDDVEPVNEITVTLTPSTQYPKVGDNVSVSMSIGCTITNIKSFQIKVDGTDSLGAALNLLDQSNNVGSLSYGGNFSFEIPKNVKSGNEFKIKLDITLDDNTKETKEATVAVAKYFYNARPGIKTVLGHRVGPLPWIYDLDQLTQLSNGDDESLRDLEEISADGTPFSASFSAKNATRYVDLGNSFDISTLNDQNMASIFSSKTEVSTITMVVGSKVLVKLRGTDVYTLIDVTLRDDTFLPSGSSSLNKGKIECDVYRVD